ncbi:tetratricopeptide repeat protein [Chamaesiphon sp. VAR_69_metabat_338]|uniref:tetratricopeptide repeat protein n=1 Tax=Chamaesiphon sp. VAR_69_metabat_338 TaxID=2964704 RepID=UPI00286E49FC|nr:tetratricopeptide repeat protein [Chamaesiphon sp. VAR_69_metabat_338]
MSATLVFIITGFWIWMLTDCSQDKSTRSNWFWIVLFGYFPGALVYFIDRQSTSQSRKIINPLRRIQLQQELHRAKIAAKHIGKAYQFLILGNILLELGDLDRAELAYQRALIKEPKNPYALWGAASVAFDRERFAVAALHLELLLKIDPKHLQGDASLLYAKVLFNLSKWSIARLHLTEDIYC